MSITVVGLATRDLADLEALVVRERDTMLIDILRLWHAQPVRSVVSTPEYLSMVRRAYGIPEYYDAHTVYAAIAFGRAYDEVNAQQRRWAKVTMWGPLYAGVQRFGVTGRAS